MPQQTLTDNSPWMKALLSLSQDGGGDFNMVDDAQQRAAATPTPASAPPAHRIEDDKTAGVRGTSPQSDQASQPSQGAIAGSIAAGQTTQLADRVQKPPSLLAQRIDENKAKLGSLGTDTAPKTLGDTVLPGGGFWRGLGRTAINAVGGGMGQTRRDEAFKNTLSERTALQSSIDTDTREESRENVTEEGQTLRARMAAQAQIAAAQRLGETLRSREGVAAGNRDSREGIAADNNQGRMDLQDSKSADAVAMEDQRQRGRMALQELRNKVAGLRISIQGHKIPPLVGKAFDTYQDSQSRYDIMEQNVIAGKRGDQQAMLSLLANHLGMTMGLAKGARINQAIITEAQQSAPWLARMQARFDDRGYLTGVTLTPEQMDQMVDLARSRVAEDGRKVTSMQTYFDVPPPPNAPNASTPQQQPQRPANVPAGWTYNANGPKGKGWYAPKRQ